MFKQLVKVQRLKVYIRNYSGKLIETYWIFNNKEVERFETEPSGHPKSEDNTP